MLDMKVGIPLENVTNAGDIKNWPYALPRPAGGTIVALNTSGNLVPLADAGADAAIIGVIAPAETDPMFGRASVIQRGKVFVLAAEVAATAVGDAVRLGRATVIAKGQKARDENGANLNDAAIVEI